MSAIAPLANAAPLLVGNARTALKLALRQIGLKSGDGVLMPGFICDVVLHPIAELGMRPVFHELDDGLAPQWESLETLAVRSECRALVMVHYFGQPQDVHRFRDFCSRHRLRLIEDNAHGYGGCLGTQALGTLGDIGISSPRKLLGIPSGGALHGSNASSREAALALKPFPAHKPVPALKLALSFFPPVRRRLRAFLDRSKPWNDPRLFRETLKPDFGIDRYSRRRIALADWAAVASRRRARWGAWQRFTENRGLNPVFPIIHAGSCPTAWPAYARNLAERDQWLRWGVRNQIPLYPWPALPEMIIAEEGRALARWRRLVCFPLDLEPGGVRPPDFAVNEEFPGRKPASDR